MDHRRSSRKLEGCRQRPGCLLFPYFSLTMAVLFYHKPHPGPLFPRHICTPPLQPKGGANFSSWTHLHPFLHPTESGRNNLPLTEKQLSPQGEISTIHFRNSCSFSKMSYFSKTSSARCYEVTKSVLSELLRHFSYSLSLPISFSSWLLSDSVTIFLSPKFFDQFSFFSRGAYFLNERATQLQGILLIMGTHWHITHWSLPIATKRVLLTLVLIEETCLQ
jgi:hypothetical protein